MRVSQGCDKVDAQATLSRWTRITTDKQPTDRPTDQASRQATKQASNRLASQATGERDEAEPRGKAKPVARRARSWRGKVKAR